MARKPSPNKSATTPAGEGSTSQELVKQQGGGAVAAPADLDLFAGEAGAGLENVTARELLIPRLGILQALSPQIDTRDPKFINGAKMGDIADIGLGEILPTPLIFLPVHFSKVFLEWAPRASGKGLVGVHDSETILDSCTKDEKGRYFHGANLVSETLQMFGMNMSAGGRPSFIPMASTQIKHMKKWLTTAQMERVRDSQGREFVPPLFYRTYSLDVAEESNNEGRWFGWKITPHVALKDMENFRELFANAKQFREAIVSGAARGDLSSMQERDAAPTEAPSGATQERM